MWDGADDCEDLGGIHHLLLQLHPFQDDERGGHSIEDALLVREELSPASHKHEIGGEAGARLCKA